jgi:hypothetical protein
MMERGKFSWPNGSYYSGEFDKNLFHGEGEFKWANGRKYIGKWSTGSMNGFGVFSWPDGRVYKGFFDNDQMIHKEFLVDRDPDEEID